MADQAAQLFGFGGERVEELTRQSTQNLQAVAQTSTVLARGFQDVSREYLKVVQEFQTRSVESFTALLRCRSVQDVMAAQSEFVRNSLEQTVDGTRRLAEVSTRVANEASQTLSEHTRRGARPRAA
ncbi:MAG TPA: phasin family protein [Microvirga sp.]|nr:phasin family protein [Microvirga sp.]